MALSASARFQALISLSVQGWERCGDSGLHFTENFATSTRGETLASESRDLLLYSEWGIRDGSVIAVKRLKWARPLMRTPRNRPTRDWNSYAR